MNEKLLFLIFIGFILTACNSNQAINKVIPSVQQTEKHENINKSDEAKENTLTNTPELGKDKGELGDEYCEITVFWSRFRTAILNKNIEEINEFIQFPLETRGSLDTDPIIKFDKDKSEDVIRLFLNEKTGFDLNCIDTNFDYIKKCKKLDSINSKEPIKNWVRAGNMQFKKNNNNWKLTFVYLDEDSYKKLGKDIRK